MKAIFQIILVVAVGFLSYWLYSMITTPVEFNEVREAREKVVVERLKDIRTIQRSFRNEYGHFAGSFEDLIHYYNNDSLEVQFAMGSADDSAAMGNLVRVTTYVKLKDTLFNHRGTNFSIDEIQYIPYSELATGSKVRFTLDTTTIETDSEVLVPVFESYAPYVQFLGDLDEQELINYRDIKVNTLKRADGLRVGSITETNNEAGNWE